MSEQKEREQSQAAPVVISELRWKLNQWQPVEGEEDAAWWANELDCVLSTLRHAVGNDWEDAAAYRGVDDSCDAAWPSIGIERSDSRWAADRWCRIVLGVLRNRPSLVVDPYDAVLGVGLWIVGKGAEPTEQDWARWPEANLAAVTAIAATLPSGEDATAPKRKDRWNQEDLKLVMKCGVDTVRRVREEAGISSGHPGKPRTYNRDEVQQMIECCLAKRPWHDYAKALKLLVAK